MIIPLRGNQRATYADRLPDTTSAPRHPRAGGAFVHHMPDKHSMRTISEYGRGLVEIVLNTNCYPYRVTERYGIRTRTTWCLTRNRAAFQYGAAMRNADRVIRAIRLMDR